MDSDEKGIDTVNALIERVNTVLQKHWDGGNTCIYGTSVSLHRAKRWWYIKGTDDATWKGGYVWAKIDRETLFLFSHAGKVPICHLSDMEDGNISAYGIQRMY